MDYYDDSLFSSFIGGIAVFAIIIIVLLIAYVIVAIIASWKIYKKAGKSGWECIVPVYSYWVLVEIAELDWWWFLLAISNTIISMFGFDDLSSMASLISLFANFNIYYNIAKKFNKTNGTAVCAGLFSGIFAIIFGFSKSEVYNKGIPVSKNGIFGTPEHSFNSSVNSQNNATYTSTEYVDNSNTNNQNYNTSSVYNDINNKEYSFCGNCGTKLNKDVRFCPNCGKEKII